MPTSRRGRATGRWVRISRSSRWAARSPPTPGRRASTSSWARPTCCAAAATRRATRPRPSWSAPGLCSILTSDYYYPAPLHAVFRLAGEGALPLERAWDLVAANPADALGLADRGRIEAGRRADLLLVDPGPDGALQPDVVATLVEGRRAFSAVG